MIINGFELNSIANTIYVDEAYGEQQEAFIIEAQDNQESRDKALNFAKLAVINTPCMNSILDDAEKAGLKVTRQDLSIYAFANY